MGGRLLIEEGYPYEDDDYPEWNPWELKRRYAYLKSYYTRNTRTNGETMKHGETEDTD